MVASFTAGQKLRASDLLAFPLGLVARNQRTTTIATTASTAGTAQRILSTGGPVVSGRIYRVSFRGAPRCSAVDATAELWLRYTTNGTEPTASSTGLAQCDVELGTADVPETVFLSKLYVPGSDHTFTVTAAFHRAVGSGTVTMDTSSTNPTEIVIEDLGESVSISGTIY